jgi:predicted  nucleic acid-binding Zn-ribbon protein
MANPQNLTVETRLYSAAEPEGRIFPAGEPWPGDAWSQNPGGAVAGANTTAQAMKDLIAAQDQNEALARQLATKDYSLAEVSAQRDAAQLLVKGLEERALEAESKVAAAEQAARDYMIERDQAREQVRKLTADLSAAEDLMAAPPKKAPKASLEAAQAA